MLVHDDKTTAPLIFWLGFQSLDVRSLILLTEKQNIVANGIKHQSSGMVAMTSLLLSHFVDI